jgi:hypothetical protein
LTIVAFVVLITELADGFLTEAWAAMGAATTIAIMAAAREVRWS